MPTINYIFLIPKSFVIFNIQYIKEKYFNYIFYSYIWSIFEFFSSFRNSYGKYFFIE